MRQWPDAQRLHARVHIIRQPARPVVVDALQEAGRRAGAVALRNRHSEPAQVKRSKASLTFRLTDCSGASAPRRPRTCTDSGVSAAEVAGTCVFPIAVEEVASLGHVGHRTPPPALSPLAARLDVSTASASTTSIRLCSFEWHRPLVSDRTRSLMAFATCVGQPASGSASFAASISSKSLRNDFSYVLMIRIGEWAGASGS